MVLHIAVVRFQGMTKVYTAVTQELSARRHEGFAACEQWEKRFDAEKKKNESLEKQLRTADAEKRSLKEQLVAANTELYVYKRTQEKKEAPTCKTEVVRDPCETPAMQPFF